MLSSGGAAHALSNKSQLSGSPSLRPSLPLSSSPAAAHHLLHSAAAGHPCSRSSVVVRVASPSNPNPSSFPEGVPDPEAPFPTKRDPKKRRRGRNAELRSPDDTPLRDGNRDIMAGVLTERAAKTLLIYLQELNPIVYQWLWKYIEAHPIPRKAAPWDDISGDTFLRNLLSQPTADHKMEMGKDSLFDNTASMGVDPRALAQRIMDIRVQLSMEFIQDLKSVQEDNNALLQETLMGSLNSAPATHPIPTIKVLPPLDKKIFVHPELINADGTLDAEVARNHPELEAALQRQQAEESNKKQGKEQNKK